MKDTQLLKDYYGRTSRPFQGEEWPSLRVVVKIISVRLMNLPISTSNLTSIHLYLRARAILFLDRLQNQLFSIQD